MSLCSPKLFYELVPYSERQTTSAVLKFVKSSLVYLGGLLGQTVKRAAIQGNEGQSKDDEIRNSYTQIQKNSDYQCAKCKHANQEHHILCYGAHEMLFMRSARRRDLLFIYTRGFPLVSFISCYRMYCNLIL
eukprot:TRINITY_DN72499_c0_g1_i1.p1 TRINITY_DN72499_c0_g1~~TRINITY_DN72499_c0_g1_i1.p1  ORF type:complete len:132 (-),score=12.77 TRINITY_DN72499_c0_g1_i1:70-465(-)